MNRIKHFPTGAFILALGLPGYAQVCTTVPNLPPGRVVWSEADGQVIRSSDLDGGGVTTLYSSPGTGLFGIELDEFAAKLYFTSDGSQGGGIFRMGLDGSGVESLVGGQCLGLAVDPLGGRMYWTDFTAFAPRIRSANLDGSGVSTIVTDVIDPIEVVVDSAGGRLFWTDLSKGTIGTSDLAGNGVADLVTGLDSPSGLQIDVVNGWLYYTLINSGELHRVGMDGTGDVLLSSGLGTAIGIAVSGALDLLIVADEGSAPNTGKLWVSDIDGSGSTTLLTGLDLADDVILYHDPVPSLYHDVSNICLASGGQQDLIIDAGQSSAGDLYAIAGSATGTAGIPVGGLVLPLSFDAYTTLTLVGDPGLFSGFVGFIGPDGRAKATISLAGGAAPSLAGITLFHAAIVFDLPTLVGLMTTNAAPVLLQS